VNQQSDYIKNTFNQEFNKDNFRKFLNNSFTNLPLNNDKEIEPEDEEYAGYINKYQKIAEYTDSERNKLAFLVVELKSNKTVERARSKQRNFAVKYLERNNFDAGLIAYYSRDEANWRFSLVKIDYKRVQNAKGEWTTSKEISSAKRYSFLIEPEQGNHTTIKQLQAFIATQNLKLSQIEDLFSVEKVTKEFYKQIAILFTKLVGGDRKTGSRTEHFESLLELPSTNDETIKKEFAVRLLGRTLFCWFLKKKKSNKNISLIPDDLLSLKALKENSNYYHKILEPLFFQVLNQEPAKRLEQYNKESWNLIPFLNGGLFEPHTQDYYKLGHLGISQYINNLKIPDNWFEELFELFERYNFTIDESSSFDMEVSIDPEMLGRIFENLLAEINPETGESARKATGSYYTPRPIVEYMVDSSLKEYLKTATGIEEEKINNLIEKDDFTPQPPCNGEKEENLTGEEQDRIISALEKVKILDPACGSGAFPMGILQRIVDILQKIDKDSVKWLEKMKHSMLNSISSTLPYNLRKNFESSILHEIEYLQKKESPDYIRKKGIIQNSIYGLDIQSVATEIARLRFFLSLIVDQTIDENESNRGIKPLPNLEFKFVTANTLIGLNKGDYQKEGEFNKKAEFTRQISLGQDVSIEAELESIRNDYFSIANSTEKIAIKRRFLECQSRLAKQWQEKAIKKEDTTLSQQLAEWNPFEDKASSWFDPEWMFGVKDGFDIVIGNPPYIKEYTFRNAFNGLRESPYYKGKMDIWYFFACRGLDFLKYNGIQSFIAQNNWVTSFGASILRNKITQEAQILEFLNFGNYKVFESADIQTMLYIIKKNKQDEHYSTQYSELIDTDLEEKALNCFLDFNYPYEKAIKYTTEINRNECLNSYINFTNPLLAVTLNKIKSSGTLTLLENEIAQGVVAPQDFINKQSQKTLEIQTNVGQGIFALSHQEKENCQFTEKELNEVIKPYYTSKELHKYYGDKEHEYWLIYTKSNANRIIEKYPNVKKHLDKFTNVITSDNKPYGLHRAREESFFVGGKIISFRKCAEPTFTYTNFDCYVSATFFIIKTDRINLKYLTGLLNSKLVAFWLRYRGKMQGNNYQVDKEPLMNIPIPLATPIQQKAIIDLVEKILFLKQENKDTTEKDTTELEHQIDLMVYKLYELNYEEIKIIDPEIEIKTSKAEYENVSV
jgi:adenine-specific DNA-methyltransferase